MRAARNGLLEHVGVGQESDAVSVRDLDNPFQEDIVTKSIENFGREVLLNSGIFDQHEQTNGNRRLTTSLAAFAYNFSRR